MPVVEMYRPLHEIVEIAQQNGQGITFHVSKVDRRRWNWELSARYMEADPVNGQLYPKKSLLRTGNNRDTLEAVRAESESQYRDS